VRYARTRILRIPGTFVVRKTTQTLRRSFRAGCMLSGRTSIGSPRVCHERPRLWNNAVTAPRIPIAISVA